MTRGDQTGSGSAAFLIAQVGAHASSRFAERLEPLGFGRQHAGILRLIGRNPGMSQQDLARSLHMHASQLVGVIDDLQHRGLVERRPSAQDRRLYALHLTAGGEKGLAQIGKVAAEHNNDLLASLNESERSHLSDLLSRIAVHQGLSAGVHPGYGGSRRGVSLVSSKTRNQKTSKDLKA